MVDKIKIQDNNPLFNQYWFYVDTPEYNLYPKSDCSTFNLGKSVKMNKRIVAFSTPKIIDSNKNYKYIINTDFNIDGTASDWMCSTGYYEGMGGLIDDGKCSINPNFLLKNFTDLFKSLIEKDYIIIHLSMIAEDTYLNQPCDSTNVCKKCWFKDNPDQQYLQSLFNLIYQNKYPQPINNLKLDYNNLTLFGYSVGAGAVSRYINDFPILKTVPNNFVFPQIKTAIMIAGGSLYCYSKDCGNDTNCGGDKHFKNCPFPNIKVRGCCPHDLSEPNYDNGVFKWKNHPSVLLVQSIDDSYADPMASKYYYDILRKHGVNTKRITAESTIHGLDNEYQVSKIIEWIQNETNKKNSDKKNAGNKNIKHESNNSELFKYFSIFLIIVAILLFITNLYKFNYVTILVSLVLILISSSLTLINKNQDNNENEIIDDYLEESLRNITKYPQVTAGELFDKVVEIQNDIYEKNPDIGGILVHLLTLEQMENIVNQKEFSLKFSSGGIDAFTDCSMPGQNKQNCSAWTYLRKDLPPIVYSYPSTIYGPNGWQTPTVGIIVDASRFWPLITTLGVIDSATDQRNCGTQDSSFQFNIFDVNNHLGRCNPIVYDKYDNPVNNQEKYCIFQSDSTSVGCNTNCTYSDDIINTNCRMQNSGGSLNSSAWYNSDYPGYYWDCPNVNNRYNWTDKNFPNGLPNCYKAIEINWKDISEIDKKHLNENNYGNNGSCKYWAKWIPSKDCYLTSPTLYQTKNLSGEYGEVGNIINGTNLEVVNNGTKQKPINNDRNYLYIGKNVNNNIGGPTYSEQTWQNCTFNTQYPTNCQIKLNSDIPISTNNMMNRHAKFIKKDFGRWLKEIKKLWKYIYGTLDKYQGYKNLTSKVDGNGKYNYNSVYGNPCFYATWWENEVNVFVNENMAQNENSSLNKTLRTSILGFFYIGKTCEDYTNDLPTGTDMGQGCIFNNAQERCVGYLCNTDVNTSNPDKTICSTKINNKSVNYEYVKNEELERIENARIIVKTLTDKFNEKYRNDTQHKAKSYKLMTYSNAFQSYNALDLTFNNELKSDDILQEY